MNNSTIKVDLTIFDDENGTASKLFAPYVGLGPIEIPSKILWFFIAVIEMVKTAAAKNHDYAGSSPDWKDNFSHGGLRGMCDRMGDKMKRLRNLLPNPDKAKVSEKLQDTCLDLATYSILLMGAIDEGLSFKGEWPE